MFYLKIRFHILLCWTIFFNTVLFLSSLQNLCNGCLFVGILVIHFQHEVPVYNQRNIRTAQWSENYIGLCGYYLWLSGKYEFVRSQRFIGTTAADVHSFIDSQAFNNTVLTVEIIDH